MRVFHLPVVSQLLQMVQHSRSRADAGVALRCAEAAGQVVVHGADPATCLVELVAPPVPTYATPPRIPIAAWLAAWHVAQFPAPQRALAIRQDLTTLRAGILVLARLDLRDDPSLPAVLAWVRFDEAVAVAHHWFLLARHGNARGMRHYTALLAQVRSVDVALEAHLALAGLAHHPYPPRSDDLTGGFSQEVPW